MENFETKTLDNWNELDEVAENIIKVKKHIKKQKERIDLKDIDNTSDEMQIFKYYHMKYQKNCLMKDFWLIKTRRAQYDYDFYEISYKGSKTKRELKERIEYCEKKEDYYDKKIHEYYGECAEFTTTDYPNLGSEKRYLRHPNYPKEDY
jgi:hypothetical protein